MGTNNLNEFVIFLDIDGVMWDWNYLKEVQAKSSKMVRADEVIDPRAITALNRLIGILDNGYDVSLVVSSTWRNIVAKRNREYMLKENGLKYSKPIGHTILRSETKSDMSRAEEIEEYLSRIHMDAKGGNYVVIDDEVESLKPFVHMGKVIQTSMSKGLREEDVFAFIRSDETLKRLESMDNDKIG